MNMMVINMMAPIISKTAKKMKIKKEKYNNKNSNLLLLNFKSLQLRTIITCFSRDTIGWGPYIPATSIVFWMYFLFAFGSKS